MTLVGKLNYVRQINTYVQSIMLLYARMLYMHACTCIPNVGSVWIYIWIYNWMIYSACPALTGLFCLSSFNWSILLVPLWLVYSALSHFDWSVLLVPLWLVYSACPCFNWSILLVPLWLVYSACPALIDLFCLSRFDWSVVLVPHWLIYSACPALIDLFCIRSFLINWILLSVSLYRTNILFLKFLLKKNYRKKSNNENIYT